MEFLASVSPCASSGSNAVSDLLAMDVDAALRELAAGDGGPASRTPAQASTTSTNLSGRNSDNDLDRGVQHCGFPEESPPGAPVGSELQAELGDAESSAESSDSDVIHIDLTQRPPPLPRGPGLPLEQIVTMLPGDTYAVAGSGIPMRTQPELRQRSPSARSGGGAATKDTSPVGSSPTGSGGDGRSSPGAQPGAAEPGDLPPRGSSSGARASGGGSPRMGFTFIPGLGLVPIVLDATDLDDDGDDEDMGEDGLSGGVIIEEHSVEQPGAGNPDEAAAAEAAAPPSGSLGSQSGSESSLDAAVGGASAASPSLQPLLAAAADDMAEEALHDMLSGLAGWEEPYADSEDAVAAATHGGGEASDDSSSPHDGVAQLHSFVGPTGGLYDITEAQLQDIIQQAVHGMAFGELLSDEDMVGDDDDDDDDDDYDDNDDPPADMAWRVGVDLVEDADGLEEAEDETEAEAEAVAPVSEFAKVSSAARLSTLDELLRTIEGGGSAGSAVSRQRSVDAMQPSRLSDLFERAADDKPSSEGGNDGSSGGSGGGASDGPSPAGAPSGGSNSDGEDNIGDEDDEYEYEYEVDVGVDDTENSAGREQAETCDTLSPTPLSVAAAGQSMGVQASAHAEDGQAESGASSLAAAAADDNVSLPSRSSFVPTTTAGSDTADDGSRVRVLGHPPSTTALSSHLTRSRYAAPVPSSEEADADSSSPRVPTVPPAGSLSSTSTFELGSSFSAPLPKRSSGLGFSASLPSPFAGGVLDMSITSGSGHSHSSASAGSSLNSTVRMSSQSLSAIRQAALRAESQRQAEVMAERLGGGGAKPIRASANAPNPFATAGFTTAEHEVSQGAPRRNGGGSCRTGYASVDAGGGAASQHADGAAGDDDGVLEDLLRDRSIIQPRYPTDAGRKPRSALHDEDDVLVGGAGAAMLGVPPGLRRRSGSGGGDLPSLHRRSTTPLDLEALAAAEDSPAQPPARSLIATRKSDDGHVPMPIHSSSPRSRGSGSVHSSSSSSAHSVTDERLVEELEALREELGQKTTLVAGLRGELRKYTDLAMRLEHQLGEMRSQGIAGTGSQAARAGSRSQSENGMQAHFNPLFSVTDDSTYDEHHADANRPSQPSGVVPVLAAALGSGPPPLPHPEGTRPPPGTPPPPAEAPAHATHTPPPHPQAQGLDSAARFGLYNEVLSQAQMHVARSGIPAPPDLRDVQELLQGKDVLDAGAEKVMLIKLRKLVVWGCDAAWKASTAQQHARSMEQQAAHARAEWEAEREQITAALETARAAAALSETAAGGGAGDGGALRRQLEASREEAVTAQVQVSELESVVASLNADVIKLRGQLRRSRDGSLEQQAGHAASGAAAAGAAGGPSFSRNADSAAWGMERQMLLKTITSLKQELEESRAAAAAVVTAATEGADGISSAGALAHGSDDEAKRVALHEAMVERMEQLRTEREAAAAENAGLRRQLEEALAAAAAERTDLQARLGAAGEASAASAALYRAQVNQLEQELAAARRTLEEHDARAAEGHGERAAAVAAQEAEIQELRRQLLTVEAELQEAKDAAQGQATARGEAEAELQRAGDELDAARQLAMDAEAATVAARKALLEQQQLQQQEQAERLAALEAGNAELQGRLQDMTASRDALQLALASEAEERSRLQLLLDARTQELAQRDAQLSDVHAAIAQLQAEVPALQAQVAELQGILSLAQREREEAEARAAEAMADAEAAEQRAEDAVAAMAAAQEELAAAREATEAYARQAASLEDKAAQARADAEGNQALLQAAHGEAEELRTRVGALEAEVEDLRTALADDDSPRAVLQEQLDQMEAELEAQKALSQVRADRVVELEAALADAEERYSSARAAAASATEAAAAAAGVETDAAASRSAATAAQQRAEELAAQVAELQRLLSSAEEQLEQAGQSEAELRRRLAEAEQRRERAEQQLTHMEVQLEAAREEIDELRREEAVRSESVAALRDKLQASLADREALRQSASELRQQLEAVVHADAVRSPVQISSPLPPPAAPDQQLQQPQLLLQARGSGELRELREEKARLLADVARLQAEVERARATDGGGPAQDEDVDRLGARAALTVEVLAEAEARAEALQAQLQVARGELQAAAVELSMKGELLAARDRSLSTLQETVAALKVALQATQQVGNGAGGSGERHHEGTSNDHAGQYESTMATLQSRFADSEITIRRLEQQVAALEYRLASKGGANHATKGESPDEDGKVPVKSPRHSHSADAALAELRAQLQVKDEEINRLLDELEAARVGGGRNSARSIESISPSRYGVHGATAGADTGVVSVATVHELQTQNIQLRSLSEDLNARYLSKKEAVRRLRAQLAAEQQRRADENARSQRHLEAACQRLSRLATDLGNTIRRCITLDLQPLSATSLTPSGHPQYGGGDALADINALAALLARQGAALVESLETALEQATSAREERALLSAQLAHRQAALDELRYQLSRSGLGPPDVVAGGGAFGAGAAAGAGIATAGGGLMAGSAGSQVSVQLGSSMAAELWQNIASTSGAAPALTSASPRSPPAAASHAWAPAPGQAARPLPKPAPPTSTTLAQDMAALSAQQAGVRNALHQFERSQAQQALPKFPRSYGPGNASYSVAAGAGHTTIPIARISPSNGAGDALGGAKAKAPSFLGLLAGERSDGANGFIAASVATHGIVAASTGANALRQTHSPHRAQPAPAGMGSLAYGLSPRGAHDAAGGVPLQTPAYVPLSRARGSVGYSTYAALGTPTTTPNSTISGGAVPGGGFGVVRER